jgi:deoxyribonuclease-4
MDLIIGSHVSFKNDTQLVGSVKETLEYKANAFMFYTGAPQNTNRKDINDNITMEAYQMMKDNNIDLNNVVVHAPYIINLSNSNNFDFSVNFLTQECERCNQLGINKIILHPGSAVNGMDRKIAIKNIIDGLNIILDNNYNVKILLETMAGKGNEIGKDFEELGDIIKGIKYKDKIGICLDTCHINDAGYNIENFDKILDDLDNIVGLKYLGCIHVNDSKNVIASHKDRHENIGFGTIGFEKLIKIIYNKRIENIPKILETPYITADDTSKERLYPPYKYEIEMIRNKKFDQDMIKKIRKDNIN